MNIVLLSDRQKKKGRLGPTLVKEKLPKSHFIPKKSKENNIDFVINQIVDC